MKIYHFTTESYDFEYIVMAETPHDALEFIKQKVENTTYSKDIHQVERFKDSSILNLPDRYKIKEYNYNEVLVLETA